MQQDRTKQKVGRRVQGGWSKPANSEQKTRPPIDPHKQPPWLGKDPDLPTSTFTFSQPKPEDYSNETAISTVMITDSGVYDLSTTDSGVSRVRLFTDFLDQLESDRLFNELYETIPWEQKYDNKHGMKILQPRMVAWYANSTYSYSGLTHPARPDWPEQLTALKDGLEAKTGQTFNSVLCNLYRDGKDHVAWHSDGEELFGSKPTIASISLGDTRMFELRRLDTAGNTEELVRIPLTHGSLILMEGATQSDWQHRIPPEYHDRGPRINLTYRLVTKSQS